MLSISSISTGQAERYYRQDNYYLSAKGDWQGKGAKGLGLEGQLSKEDFEHLLNGLDTHGRVLVEAARANGEHRAGVDLTFSAPKSVSILSEVVRDNSIREAHERAVSATLSHVEARYAQARQTRGGITERVDTRNLVIAKFQHTVSRELDPQLHTHALIMNLTKRPDGPWRALSNEELYIQKMYIGQHYRNELASNLKELGYVVERDHKGLFEVPGVDRKLLEHFSQRSEQIEAKARKLKESGRYQNANVQKLREMATLGSRVAKREVDHEIVRQVWAERLEGLGYTRESVRDAALKAAEREKAMISADGTMRSPQEPLRLAGEILTGQESTFTREEIMRVAGKLSLGEHRMSNLEKALEAQCWKGEVVQLDRNTYTTREMLKIEREIVNKVRDGHEKADQFLSKEEIKALLNEHHSYLTQGQKNAVSHILASMDRIIGIQGDAGTGKTTALKVVKQELDRQAVIVRGLGFTGKSAEQVELNAGIKSQTLDSFLSSAKLHNTGGKQVWIVDEASMVGSRKLSELVRAAEKAEAKLVLIGDFKQLQAVEAGRMFGKLQELGALRTVTMSEILRQQSMEYKAVVRDVSAKKIDSAFVRLERQGKLHELTGRQERLAAVTRDFLVGDHKNTLIVTARNTDRNELNTAIRNGLKAMDRLHGEELIYTVREAKNLVPVERHFAQSYQTGDVIYSQKAGVLGRAGTEARVFETNTQNHTITAETSDGNLHAIDLTRNGDKISVWQEKQKGFTVGDRIVFLKNDKTLGVHNGVTGAIKSLDDKGNIRVITDAGKEVSFNAGRYRYYDHGYAVTIYKSQGQTSREVLYHADTARDANYNQFYVAVTRGKDDLRVYTDDREVLKDLVKVEQSKTSTLDYREPQKIERTESTGRDPEKIADRGKDQSTDKANNIRGREDREYER